MANDQRHRAFLRFIRKVVDLTSSYSMTDLAIFRDLSVKDYASLTPLVEEYLRFAERAQTDVPLSPRKPGPARTKRAEMHLFDLLRDKRLFPQNSDLAEFAGRIFPEMTRHRFDKMSRGDIAARIIEYLETLDPRTRERLEASMHEALNIGKPSDKQSFFSQWEKIIKGIQL